MSRGKVNQLQAQKYMHTLHNTRNMNNINKSFTFSFNWQFNNYYDSVLKALESNLNTH